MPKVNKELSQVFGAMADLLEIRGKKEDVYRVRAYRSASLAIVSEGRDALRMNVKELEEIPGVGKAIAEKIVEYRDSGKISAYQKLEKSLPTGLPKLLEIPGLGPKHVKQLWKELDITTLSKLKAALEKGVVAELPGFGKKSVQKLVEAISDYSESTGRLPRKKVLPIANKIVKNLKKISGVAEVVVCGSLRRKKSTVHDIDILVSSKNPARCAKDVIKSSFWGRMIGKGETKVSGKVDNVQCDIRVVAPDSFGAAVVYFTGSKGLNIYLRKIAIAKDMKLNEYGLFDSEGEMIAGETEKGIFEALGVKYLKPEERDSY